MLLFKETSQGSFKHKIKGRKLILQYVCALTATAALINHILFVFLMCILMWLLRSSPAIPLQEAERGDLDQRVICTSGHGATSKLVHKSVSEPDTVQMMQNHNRRCRFLPQSNNKTAERGGAGEDWETGRCTGVAPPLNQTRLRRLARRRVQKEKKAFICQIHVLLLSPA